MSRRPPPARDLAVRVLSQAQTEGRWVEDLMAEVLRRHPHLPPPERALLLELVQGVKRWEIRLDWVLSRLLPRPLGKLHPRVRVILRLGAYQLLFLTRIPAHAAVHEAVAQVREARLPEAHAGLVNAVLRRLAREGPPPLPPLEANPVAHLSLAHAHPEWLVARWLKRFGPEETARRLAANNRLPPFTLRVNTLKISREALSQRLAAEGLTARPLRYYPEGLQLTHWQTPPPQAPSSREGLWRFQDEGAMLAVLLLPLAPGARVLEIGAGRGGKTTHLAERLRNQGLVAAVERNRARLKELGRTLGLWGAKTVFPVRADATRPLPFRPAAFDTLLIDAPCSALGILRRHPEIKTRLTEADLASFPPRQLALLAQGAAVLRPGGHLLYLTCTTEPEENEAVIAAFLREHPEFRRLRDPSGWPEPVRPFCDSEGYFRTSPADHGLDGFFGALLHKGRFL